MKKNLNTSLTVKEFEKLANISIKNKRIANRDMSEEPYDPPIWGYLNDRSVQEAIQNFGYDGVVGMEDHYMTAGVFNSTQIKSIFNKGTFNPHDPRISFRMAPTNLVTPLAKIYQEQKGNKKSYTKENFELDLVRLEYPEKQ